ncbi:MAG: LptF/LptG family permease [Planctomycetes bacterium]|nr:LptF/LptG family permease [Planctomycetota bacterium]
MWKLHRYYLKELTINVGITFLVLFAVVLTSLVYRGIQRSQGGSPIDAVLIVVYWALDSFQHLLTISFLLATVTTFTRAAMDRELTAIRAAGISPRVPLAAAILVGLFLTALGSFALHYAIPTVHFQKYRVIPEAIRNAFLSMNLGGDRLKLPNSDYLMTFRSRDADRGEFYGCTVYCPKPPVEGVSPILFVDKVSMPGDKKSPWLRIVFDGIHDPLGGATMGSHYEAVIARDSLTDRGRRDERDDDLRSDQLLAEVQKGVHRRPYEAVYSLFRRCCFSLMPLVLAPIGFCIAEFARDRGRVAALLLSLVPLGLFYLGEVMSARLLLSSQNPWVGWLPLGFLAVFGLPLCWRQLRR